jgi:hypothetical protein
MPCEFENYYGPNFCEVGSYSRRFLAILFNTLQHQHFKALITQEMK